MGFSTNTQISTHNNSTTQNDWNSSFLPHSLQWFYPFANKTNSKSSQTSKRLHFSKWDFIKTKTHLSNQTPIPILSSFLLQNPAHKKEKGLRSVHGFNFYHKLNSLSFYLRSDTINQKSLDQILSKFIPNHPKYSNIPVKLQLESVSYTQLNFKKQ